MTLNLSSAIHTREPGNTILDELLRPRPQLRLVQVEIVYGADAQDALPGESRADAVHQRPARGTEVVGHGVSRGGGARLAPGRQVLAAAEVSDVLVVNHEVGGEHGSGDFAAIRTVAHEGVDQAWAFGRLRYGKQC